MGHTPQIHAAEIKKNKTYNYKPSFEYIAPIIRAADLAIGNLEVTLPGRPPYSGYPTFQSPDDLAKDLKWAGFDVLVTANNHSNDSGKRGCLATNSFSEIKLNGSDLSKLLVGINTLKKKNMIKIMQCAIDQGELNSSDDPEIMANLMLSFMVGLNMHAKKSNSLNELLNMTHVFIAKMGFKIQP